MTQSLYIFIGLCMIILQSAIMTHISLFDRFYDLLMPFVVYVGLFRTVQESMAVIILFGFVMDSLTGGPFGLYITSYFWTFITARWIIKLFHARHTLILLFVVAASVLMQNLIFISSLAIITQGSRFPESAFKIVSTQVLWAMFTGPLFLIFYGFVHQHWDKWLDRLRAERDR
jgi:rod shape-determining protein MreD